MRVTPLISCVLAASLLATGVAATETVGLAPNAVGTLHVTAGLDGGGPTEFLLDTGSAYVVLSTATRDRLRAAGKLRQVRSLRAVMANNAAVTRDVPPYLMVTGQPAEPHSVNAEGLKRRGFTPEQIRNIRGGYKVLYRSGLKLAEATEQLQKLAAEQPELKPFVEFLATTTRSIVR